MITEGGFGWWCESDSVEAFSDIIHRIVADGIDTVGKGYNGFEYLQEKYTVELEITNFKTIVPKILVLVLCVM